MSKEKKYFLIVLGCILITALSRLFPHLWNFTPIAAIALFGGVYFKDIKWAFIAPIACLLFSDLLLQGKFIFGIAEYPALYSGIWMTYLSFALVIGLGILIRKKPSVLKVMGASIVGSVLFFLITNFGAWMTDHQYYPVKSVESLIYAYELGLPFFRGTLMGDLFYNAVLFGSFAFLSRKVDVLQPQTVRVKRN